MLYLATITDGGLLFETEWGFPGIWIFHYGEGSKFFLIRTPSIALSTKKLVTNIFGKRLPPLKVNSHTQLIKHFYTLIKLLTFLYKTHHEITPSFPDSFLSTNYGRHEKSSENKNSLWFEMSVVWSVFIYIKHYLQYHHNTVNLILCT